MKRNFTDDDRLRLRAALDIYSRTNNLSQSEVAGLLGMSQPALSNYLSLGKSSIPLNTDFVLAVAELIKAEPHQLIPSLPLCFVDDEHA